MWVFGHPVVEEEELSVGEVEEKVYWAGDEGFRAGHSTIFNTITLNQAVLDPLDDRITNYVFLHEYGHTTVPWPLRMLFYAVWLTTVVGIFGAVFVVLTAIAEFLIGQSSLVAVAGRVVGTLIGAFLFGFVGYTFVRADELWADYVALQNLGVEEFKAIHEERESRDRDVSLLLKIHFWLSYPKPETVIRISEYRD